MKKENFMIKKCIGCGAVLQFENDLMDGYIPFNKYNDSFYCQRCFKLIHYNKKEVSKISLSNEDIINKLDTYVFFLTDLFNISNEVINTFKTIKVLKTLVITKSDLIPKDININKIKKNIIDTYNIEDDIVFLSSKKNDNVSIIENKLKTLNINKCYMVGFTNAGKSSLINTLINDKTITQSNMPNTTLDFIENKVNNISIIDTPGFNYTKTFYLDDEFNLIKRLNPKYYIKPLVYQTKPLQYFNIEDKLFINFDNYTNAVFYMSNLLRIKKIYKYDEEIVEFKVNGNSDIVIPTLGFINIKKDSLIKINKEMFDLIEVRNSIFGGNNNG